MIVNLFLYPLLSIFYLFNSFNPIDGMNYFEVKGGKKLAGTIIPQGAKNEALQIISAVLLTPEHVTISNIPDILDVNLLIELLDEMNVKVERPDRDTCTFQANDVNIDYLHSETFKKKSGKLRGSVMLAGPMLSRFQKSLHSKTRRRQDWQKTPRHAYNRIRKAGSFFSLSS